MPPRTKYEDTVYEKIEYSGKIFIYNSPTWKVLYPLVDIIRFLNKNTIIGFRYGKGQQDLRLYGSQYGHCVLGYELKTKKDYIEHLKAVKTIFIFSDENDPVATNFINAASSNNINIVCYSNIDKIYHFYDNINKETFQIITPTDVIAKMCSLNDFENAKKIANLFPEFEIIETEPQTKHSSLEEASKIFKEIKEANIKEKKEKEKSFTKLYDPHIYKIKQMEYERSTKNTVYPDSVELLVKKEVTKRKSLLSQLFNKKT